MDEVEKLIDQLFNGSYNMSMEAIDALGMIGPSAAPPLIQILREGKQDSSLLAQALGKTGLDDEQFEILIKMLNEEDIQERARAVESLGRIKDPRAVPYLLENLNEEDFLIRLLTVVALGEIKDPTAVPYLFEKYGEEKDLDLRKWTAISLCKIGEPAIHYLMLTLKNGEWREQNQAADVIVQVGGPAIPSLIEALMDKDLDFQRNASYALERILQNLNNFSTKEELNEFETRLQEGYDLLKEKHHNEDLTGIQMGIANIRMDIAKLRNKLAEDKGDLLDPRLKPPKKGMYQTARHKTQNLRLKTSNW